MTTVDDSAAKAALDRLVVLVQEAAFNAAMKSAKEIQDRVQTVLLSRSHPAHTKTPSFPGTPPAAISGTLAASILVTDDGESAFVGPTTDYGRIQELGGYMKGHPEMHWQEGPGVWHHSKGHSLPDRPYLGPVADFMVISGDITRIFEDEVAQAIMELG
jgi:phage gpG-like protein